VTLKDELQRPVSMGSRLVERAQTVQVDTLTCPRDQTDGPGRLKWAVAAVRGQRAEWPTAAGAAASSK
jgi:hypothetical protein